MSLFRYFSAFDVMYINPILYAMTKRIYIAIRVKQYQYIFYLKVRHLFIDFNALAWSFLLLAFVFPTIGIGCLAVKDSLTLSYCHWCSFFMSRAPCLSPQYL